MTVKELLAVADPDLIMDIAVDGEWKDLELGVGDVVDTYGNLIVNRFCVELTSWGDDGTIAKFVPVCIIGQQQGEAVKLSKENAKEHAEMFGMSYERFNEGGL